MIERDHTHAFAAGTARRRRKATPSWGRTARAWGAVLSAALLFAAPLASAAAATEVTHFRSQGALLDAHATVRNGCTTRVVSVSAFPGFEKGEYLVNYADSRFPSCPGGEFSLAEGQGQGTVTFRGNLSVARVVGSVLVTDIATGATRTVSIDLTFTGTGPIERFRRVETIVDEDMPDVTQLIALHARTRSASVTGRPALPWDAASASVFKQFALQRF